MTCRAIMDEVYESLGGADMPLWRRLRIGLHCLGCPSCGEEISRLEAARDLMRTGFFPPSPALEDPVMSMIRAEFEEELFPEEAEDPAGIPFRGWVITGFVILASLSLSFFGGDFAKIAAEEGSSFLLPLGLTIGAVITGYGALFIGTHLKELSHHFGLR